VIDRIVLVARTEVEDAPLATPKDAAGSILVNPDGLNIGNMTVGPIRPGNNAYESDAVNFGPRLGFAYNVDGSGKTVVRGGAGFLFSPQMMASLWSGVHSPLAPRRVVFSRQDAIKYGLKYPMYNDDFRLVVERQIKEEGFTSVYQVMDPKLDNPYTMSIPREKILETTKEILKTCALQIDETLSKPGEGKIVTKPVSFSKGVTTKTDLEYLAKLPADDVRNWVQGRFSLEITALPLDQKRSQLLIVANIQGRIATTPCLTTEDSCSRDQAGGR